MKSGDACPKCAIGTLGIYKTVRLHRQDVDLLKRYLRCSIRGCPARGFEVTPAGSPQRRRKKSHTRLVSSPADNGVSNV